MAITKRPITNEQANAFIAGAPDAKEQGSAPEPVKQRSAGSGKTRKKLISLTVPPTLLTRVDECADRLGLSRAAAISLAITRFVDAEEKQAQR